MSLLYHAYVYLEFLILACTIYILAPRIEVQLNRYLAESDLVKKSIEEGLMISDKQFATLSTRH